MDLAIFRYAFRVLVLLLFRASVLPEFITALQPRHFHPTSGVCVGRLLLLLLPLSPPLPWLAQLTYLDVSLCVMRMRKRDALCLRRHERNELLFGILFPLLRRSQKYRLQASEQSL